MKRALKIEGCEKLLILFSTILIYFHYATGVYKIVIVPLPSFQFYKFYVRYGAHITKISIMN